MSFIKATKLYLYLANYHNILVEFLSGKTSNEDILIQTARTNCEFLKISKNFDISTADSGKTVSVIKETSPEVSSRARNLQENVFS